MCETRCTYSYVEPLQLCRVYDAGPQKHHHEQAIECHKRLVGNLAVVAVLAKAT